MIRKLLPESRLTQAAWLAGLGLCLLLVLLPLALPPDGHPHANWQQFFGRFHPLVVHLPVAFLLLVPVLELLGLMRPSFRETAGFVLTLALLACVVSVVLGLLLAHGGGSSGSLVKLHMWSAIGLTVLVVLGLMARPAWTEGTHIVVYPILLGSSLLLMMWAAHQGGSLTHGEKYLTEFLPDTLKPSAPAAPNPASFYNRQIHPIMDRNCVSCHGSASVKGGLRLDTYDHILRGGQDGPAVVPGNIARSMLVQRITLPTTHKQFMPAEGKPPLKPEEIALIKAWIEQGASATATTLKGIEIHEPSPAAPIVPVGDYGSLQSKIEAMNRNPGPHLAPVSAKASDGLILSAADVSTTFNDDQLAQFLPYAPYIVEADLARTPLDDRALDTLAKFTHLRVLHLESTNLTANADLKRLAVLNQLTYLNLSATKVSTSTVAPLGQMKNLRHIYLYNTPAQPLPEPKP